jgi:hypothetical protein
MAPGQRAHKSGRKGGHVEPWQEEMSKRKILKLEGEDILRWGHRPKGTFSTQEAYQLLTQSIPLLPMNSGAKSGVFSIGQKSLSFFGYLPLQHPHLGQSLEERLYWTLHLPTM